MSKVNVLTGAALMIQDIVKEVLQSEAEVRVTVSVYAPGEFLNQFPASEVPTLLSRLIEAGFETELTDGIISSYEKIKINVPDFTDFYINTYATDIRKQKKLLEDKARIEKELAEINEKIGIAEQEVTVDDLPKEMCPRCQQLEGLYQFDGLCDVCYHKAVEF